MVDFKELPDDGIKFEQLIRELLVLEGYNTHWTGVGQDGGRDLVVVEKLTGDLSEYKRKWLISCKHFAHSGKSVGKDDIGDITADCNAIGAEGYILVCSTQPTANLITRLEEVKNSQKIITKFWDSIEIEKKLNKPNTFGLIHTFFPKSSQNYKWKIYNAFSPAFWAANYKNYFFYMSCRHSNTYPYLESIETIVKIFEKVPLHIDKENWWNKHYLRLRGVYYDDKHSNHVAYLDYIFPENCDKELIIDPVKLNEFLNKGFIKKYHKILNRPTWDVLYIPENIIGDSFQLDHKSYYEPYLQDFEYGNSRKEFLHDVIFQLSHKF